MGVTDLKLVDFSRPAPAETPDIRHLTTRGGVAELAPTAYGDSSACLGLALACGPAQCAGMAVWVRQSSARLDRGQPQPDGLARLGVAPDRLMAVETRRRRDALWAVEEAVKSGTVGVVLAELDGIDFTASRRLSLASAASGVPALLLLPHGRAGATAADSRWRIAACPSAPNRLDPRAPGALRWQAVLERSRQAPGAAGLVRTLELDHETLSLRVVSTLAGGPAAPDPPQGQPAGPVSSPGGRGDAEAGWQRTG